LVRLAIGTRGWYDDAAATQSRGIATAAPWCAGQGISAFFGVVVVVVEVRTVVVVDAGDDVVVVATGTVVVVVVVVVVVAAVVVVVDVGGVVVAHRFEMAAVTAEIAGSSWADVVDAVARMTRVLSATENSEPRRSQ
jgi:hypothetical protein